MPNVAECSDLYSAIARVEADDFGARALTPARELATVDLETLEREICRSAIGERTASAAAGTCTDVYTALFCERDVTLSRGVPALFGQIAELEVSRSAAIPRVGAQGGQSRDA